MHPCSCASKRRTTIRSPDPKWGVSESFTLLPPDVGEGEAARLDALRALRDAYVDALAWRMENAPGKSATFLADEKRGGEDAARALDRTIFGEGIAIPSRLVDAHEDASEESRRSARGRAARRIERDARESGGTTETMVLVVDGIVRGLAHKDARAASKQLADVADDLAQGLEVSAPRTI